MTDSVESVLQKLAEEISLYVSANQDVGYTPSPIRLRVEIREASRSALEPILAELAKYKSAIEKHLCVNDAADWLACSGGHEHVCVLCSMDKGIIPDQPGCFHDILKLTKERAEAAKQALREAHQTIPALVSETIHSMFLVDKIQQRVTEVLQQALSPPPTPAHECEQCGCDLVDGKCAVQPWHQVKPSPDSATPAGQLIVNMSTGEVLARSDHSDETITNSEAATTGKGEQG